jgi:hypothetical protein
VETFRAVMFHSAAPPMCGVSGWLRAANSGDSAHAKRLKLPLARRLEGHAVPSARQKAILHACGLREQMRQIPPEGSEHDDDARRNQCTATACIRSVLHVMAPEFRCWRSA